MVSHATLGDLLARLEPDDKAVELAAKRIRTISTGPGRALLERARHPDDPRADDADLATATIGEPLIEMLNELGPPDDLDQRRGYIDQLRELEQGATSKVARAIDGLLDDRTAPSVNAASSHPSSSRPARVCDAAFWAMAQVMSRNSHDKSRAPSQKVFLSESPQQRDVEIGKQRRRGPWQQLVQDAPEPSRSAPRLSAPELTLLDRLQRDSYVRLLETTPEAEVYRLQEPLAADTVELGRALVALSRGSNEQLAAAANRVNAKLGGLLLVPLLESGAPNGPEERASYVGDLVRSDGALHGAAKSALSRLLDDKRPLPVPGGGRIPTEEREVPRRVCDHAFLALCAMSAPGLNDEPHRAETRFLHSSTRLKEELIGRGKTTDAWKGPTDQEFSNDDED